jgi:N-glycosidase YbiA
MNDPIFFTFTTDEFGWLSNLSPHPLIGPDGRQWPSGENLYQSEKYLQDSYKEKIRQAKPREACLLGRNPPPGITLRPDWNNETKLKTMETCLRLKFSQHTDLKKMLVNTGDAKLIEHTSKDAFFGDGGDGTGANHLGELLMILRDEIRNQEERNDHV